MQSLPGFPASLESAGPVQHRSLHWAVLLLAMCFPAGMTWVYFVALAPPIGSTPGYGVLAVYVLSKVVQFGSSLVYVWIFERRRLSPSLPNFAGLAPGLGFGLLAGAAILLLYFGALRGTHYLAQLPANLELKLGSFHATTPFRYILLAVFLSVAHSLMEEYYWRWFVFGELRREMRCAPAILLSSLAFMFHHVIVMAVYMPNRFWTGALPLSMGVAVGGAAWAWLYARTGSIYSCWLSHLIIDAALMVVGYDLVFVHRA